VLSSKTFRVTSSPKKASAHRREHAPELYEAISAEAADRLCVEVVDFRGRLGDYPSARHTDHLSDDVVAIDFTTLV